MGYISQNNLFIIRCADEIAKDYKKLIQKKKLVDVQTHEWTRRPIMVV
jgi:hypothetical protein